MLTDTWEHGGRIDTADGLEKNLVILYLTASPVKLI